jgi:hypothetical protein
MAKVKVYRFKVYNITIDDSPVSTRMATQERINKIQDATRIEGTEVEIDESLLTDGMTARNFDPERVNS